MWPLVSLKTSRTDLALAAALLPAEKRSVFLERIAARLQFRRSASEADVEAATFLALTGLVQELESKGGFFVSSFDFAFWRGPYRASDLLSVLMMTKKAHD